MREEWNKGTGAVASWVVRDRMRNEGLRFEDDEIGTYLILFRDMGKASVLANSEAELAAGRTVIISLSD